MTPVPVPPTPTGCTLAPPGILTGELARWHVGDRHIEIILGTSDHGPWVAILGGLGGGHLIHHPHHLAAARDALHAAHTWMHSTPRTDPDGQLSLLEPSGG